MEAHYKTKESEIDVYNDFVIVRWKGYLIKITHSEICKEGGGEIIGGFTLVYTIETIAEKKYNSKTDFCKVFKA